MTNEYQIFGKYILLEKLAAGGMAEVFLALSRGAGGIDRFVAIKRILPQFSHNNEFIQMFKEEAKIAMNLSHSNIVPIFDFGMENNQFYLVMDFIQGKNLRQILNKISKKGISFSIEQMIFIIKEMAAGLDHAHRCLDGSTGKPLNITHRDISPQNVMVSYEGEIKIVDFGIAKAETQVDQTQAGSLKGKFGYMSPEQAEGYSVDLRTDVFSLGIIFWELLANERLFIANNEMNTLRKIRDCRIPSLEKMNPSIHPELDRIAQKALAKERNSRYQTAAELQKDLNRFLNRQYPDFSQQDLSHFFKSIYAEEILEIRRRLVEHSKNTQEIRKNLDKTNQNFTAVENTEITETEPSVLFHDVSRQTAKPNPVEDFRPPIQPLPHFDINPALLNTSLTKKNQNKETFNSGNSSSVFPHQLKNQTQSTIHNKSSTHSQIRENKKSNFPILSILSLVIFILAGFVTLHFFSPQMVKRTLSSLSVNFSQKKSITSPNQQSNVTSGEVTSSNTGPQIKKKPSPSLSPQESTQDEKADHFEPIINRVNIVVNSDPSGAEIAINGINTNLRTPSVIAIDGDVSNTIVLKKDKYLDYTSEINLKKNNQKTINATLRKATIGYVDIDVVPPLYVQLYIDNILLEKEKIPIFKYAIPALQNIKIKAVNPIDKKSVETTVRLKPEERKKVILNLK